MKRKRIVLTAVGLVIMALVAGGFLSCQNENANQRLEGTWVEVDGGYWSSMSISGNDVVVEFGDGTTGRGNIELTNSGKILNLPDREANGGGIEPFSFILSGDLLLITWAEEDPMYDSYKREGSFQNPESQQKIRKGTWTNVATASGDGMFASISINNGRISLEFENGNKWNGTYSDSGSVLRIFDTNGEEADQFWYLSSGDILLLNNDDEYEYYEAYVHQR